VLAHVLPKLPHCTAQPALHAAVIQALGLHLLLDDAVKRILCQMRLVLQQHCGYNVQVWAQNRCHLSEAAMAVADQHQGWMDTRTLICFNISGACRVIAVLPAESNSLLL
jgi:hypothetical protein